MNGQTKVFIARVHVISDTVLSCVFCKSLSKILLICTRHLLNSIPCYKEHINISIIYMSIYDIYKYIYISQYISYINNSDIWELGNVLG